MSAHGTAEGFKAVKFHCWCVPERDLPMCEAVHRHFEGSDMALMLDAEQRYDLQGAIRVARRLGELGFRWFEAPLVDTDIEGYREIKRSSTVPVIAAGNTWLDLQMLAQAIKLDCWSALRVDATICGGITPIRKIMALAEAHGMTVEIQCWGYTLTQAANLHVMLAYQNCTYFEQPVPIRRSSMARATLSAPTGTAMFMRRRATGSASASTGRRSRPPPS